MATDAAPTHHTGFSGCLFTVGTGEGPPQPLLPRPQGRTPPQAEGRAAVEGPRGGGGGGRPTSRARSPRPGSANLRSLSGRRSGASGPAAGVAARRESPLPSREIPAAAPAWHAALRGFRNAGPAPSYRRSKDPRCAPSPPPQRPLTGPTFTMTPSPPSFGLEPPRRPLLQQSPPSFTSAASPQQPLLQPGLAPSPQQPPAPPSLASACSRVVPPVPPPRSPRAAFSSSSPLAGVPRPALPPGPPPAARGSPPSAEGGAAARPALRLRKAAGKGKGSRRVLPALKEKRPSSSPGGEGGRAKQQPPQPRPCLAPLCGFICTWPDYCSPWRRKRRGSSATAAHLPRPCAR